MSRVYFTAVMQHENLGKGLPTFSFETNDHTGGGWEVGGLHPSTIATMIGKGPEITKQERFDLKFNVNRKRTSLSLVTFTTKHLPHYEWSSNGGFGTMPWTALGAMTTHFFKTPKPEKAPSRSRSGGKPSIHVRNEQWPQGRKSRENRRRDDSEASGSSRSDGYTSSSTASKRRGSHRSEYEEPDDRPSPRRTPQRSRDSSHHTDRPRVRGSRAAHKHDWGYDSGYASEGGTSSDGHRTKDSYRGEKRGRGTGERRRRR